MRDTRAYPTPLRIAPCVCREAHSMQRSDAPAPRVTPPLAGRPPLRWSAASLLPPPPEQPARVAQRHRSGDNSEAADFVEMGHFRVMRPVLPVGSCRLRRERGPEAGRDGQKRVEASRASGSSTRFRQCRRGRDALQQARGQLSGLLQLASIRLSLRVSESPRYALDRARVSRAPGRRWRTGASSRRRPRLCRKPSASAAARR